MTAAVSPRLSLKGPGGFAFSGSLLAGFYGGSANYDYVCRF